MERAVQHQSQGNTTISDSWVQCPECKDEFNKLIGGLCWACHEKTNVKELEKQKGEERIIKFIGKKGFEQHLVETFHVADGNKKALDAVKNFNPKTTSLYLWGPVGCGKTHLACAIFRVDPLAEFYKSTELIRWFRMRDPREEEEEIKRLSEVPVLVIDDLGVQKDSDHALTVLYEIFDKRDMAMRHGLVITSNLSMRDMALKMGDDRITSRIAGMCDIVEMKGSDRRLDKAQKKPLDTAQILI